MQRDRLSKKDFNINEIITTTNSILNPKKEFKIESTFEKAQIYTDPLALTQIVMNLVSNGLKYNYSTTPVITFGFNETTTSYQLKISDNGIGLSETEAASLLNNSASIAKKRSFWELWYAIRLDYHQESL